jgi:hypothetical protein
MYNVRLRMRGVRSFGARIINDDTLEQLTYCFCFLSCGMSTTIAMADGPAISLVRDVSDIVFRSPSWNWMVTRP